MQGGFDDGADYRVVDRRKSVVHPDTIATRFDQSRLTQIREMARRRGLRHVEAGVDVADANLVLAEERQDTQSRWIGKRRVDRSQGVQLFDRRRRLGCAAGT